MTSSQVDVAQIVDDLYAGTLDEVAWCRAIQSITDRVRGASTVLLGVNPMSGVIFRAETHGFSQEHVREYCTTWFDKEIRFPPALSHAVGEAMHDAKLLPVKVWQRSEIYNDFMLKLDRPWFLSFWLHKTREKFSILAIHGSRQRGPLDDGDGELIKPLVPHLRRALEIKDRLNASQVKIDTLSASLGSVTFGVIVLDGNARVLEANTAAVEIMARNRGIARNADGSLCLREPAGSELSRWALAGSPPSNNPDGLLHVPQSSGRPVSILAAPLPERTSSWMSGDPRWLLLVFDPARRIAASTELISRDLNISHREAQLTALLAEGYDLEEAATELAISINTARTHLKSVFAKTGVRSQGELIRVMVSGPAVVATRLQKKMPPVSR